MTFPHTLSCGAMQGSIDVLIREELTLTNERHGAKYAVGTFTRSPSAIAVRLERRDA